MDPTASLGLLGKAVIPLSMPQIATFAIPLVTVIGWMLGRPFSLSFDPFVTVVLTVSVIHANFIMDEATSHWLMGVQLLATYALIAIVYAI